MNRLIIVLLVAGLAPAVLAQEVPTTPAGAEAAPAPAPGSPEAAFDEAMAILEGSASPDAEALTRAAELLDKAYKGGVARPEVPYNLGVLAFRKGNMEEAARFFQEGRGLEPSNADIVAMLGLIAARQGRSGDAAALMQEALGLDEYCSVALNFLSEAEVRARNWEQALVYCRKALLGNPDNLDSYLNMAVVYYQTDRLELGELACQSALRINPAAAPIRNILGLIYLKQNEVRKAFTQFERATKADPDSMDALRNLATLVLNYKDFEAAAKAFETILQKDPENLAMRVSYAVALRGVGNFPAARTELEGVLARKPSNLDASYNLCILLHEYLSAYEDALKQCADFTARIDRKHPKWDEMKQRVKGIRDTIEALKDFGGTPPPAPGEPAPSPAPEASAPAGEAPSGGEQPPADAPAPENAPVEGGN
ncbi:MAG: tetratricopeptide repeat protein [Deltaproteobacteria bacterium]|nr:tetratricopeptide repeat protein [Deltaproteobacteria bacterium]